MSRRVYQMIELTQPRCDLRFGEGVAEPEGDPDLTKTDGQNVLSTEVDRSESITVAVDLTFNADPDGVIWEQGANVRGSYLGVTAGELVWRAGTGVSGGDTNTGMIRVGAGQFAGKTVQIVAQVYMPGTVRLFVYDDSNARLLFRESTAPAGTFGGDWAGGDTGAIGRVQDFVVLGESAADWNGSISEARFYEQEFEPSGCFAGGKPKCYQTWATCKFREAFNLEGVYRWRFGLEDQTIRLPYETDGPDDITGHLIPCVQAIRTTPTVLNIGATRRGESPFGIRSTISVSFAEFAHDDRDGDFYKDDRTDLPKAGFWQKFVARQADAIQQMQVRHYVWYEGEDISEAQVTLFDVRNLTANKIGARLEGWDPLQRAEARKAQFPRATGAELQTDISDTETSISVFGITDEIDRDYGNTGDRRYLRISEEIIEYTGWSEDDGIYTLTGVQRGVGGTEAEEHDAGDAVQRVGRYERMRFYEVALDLLENHSTLDNSLIDSAQWLDEGTRYLTTLQTSAWITDPEDVNELIGELCRDGLFFTWWDERSQSVRMQAVRPPEQGTVEEITQRRNIMRAQFDREPDDRLTRVVARYNPRNPFSDAPENYRVVQVRIDTDAEGPFQADGTIREKVINSRWINTIANGRLVGAVLLQRYTLTPVYATITMDGKDKGLEVGGFIDLETPDFVDTEGRPLVSRWEIISWEQDYRADTVTVRAQQSPYEGKFAVIMADGTLDYEHISEEDRLIGCWLAEENGLMPDGSDPYLLW